MGHGSKVRLLQQWPLFALNTLISTRVLSDVSHFSKISFKQTVRGRESTRATCVVCIPFKPLFLFCVCVSITFLIVVYLGKGFNALLVRVNLLGLALAL